MPAPRYAPRLALAVLLALPLVCTNAVRADDELEAWQKRLLRALEQGREERDRRGEERDRDPRQSLVGPRSADPDARAAAAKARARHGGRPLAVVRAGDGYRVRLLGEDGRVTTVYIED